jgi:hypothetical protein
LGENSSDSLPCCYRRCQEKAKAASATKEEKAKAASLSSDSEIEKAKAAKRAAQMKRENSVWS